MGRRFVLAVFGVLSAVALFGACIDIHPEAHMCASDDRVVAATTPLTFDDVEPIFARKCARCHDEHGSAPFALRTHDDVASHKDEIRAMVVARKMPPWPPASCCATYREPLSLSDDELGAVVGYLDQGAPPGRADAGLSPIGRDTLDRVDTVIEMPEAYLPSPADGDDDETRCFLLDWPLAETRYVTGIDVETGVPGQMHHALVLVAGPGDVDYLRDRDADDAGQGFRCPGGIVRFKDFLGGSFFQASTYPPGLGHRIDPGDKIILTMHYSPPKYAPRFVPDRTKILLRHQAEPTKRALALSVFNPAWLLGGMRIGAGKSSVTYTYEDEPTLYNGNRPFLLYAANLHMHERGALGQIAILRDNGDRECLLQIDEWNHDWQGDYMFAEPKRLEKGDRLLVSCTFDNSAEHQRVRNGRREAPRDLNWGEEEEMCIGFVTAAQAD